MFFQGTGDFKAQVWNMSDDHRTCIRWIRFCMNGYIRHIILARTLSKALRVTTWERTLERWTEQVITHEKKDQRNQAQGRPHPAIKNFRTSKQVQGSSCKPSFAKALLYLGNPWGWRYTTEVGSNECITGDLRSDVDVSQSWEWDWSAQSMIESIANILCDRFACMRTL